MSFKNWKKLRIEGIHFNEIIFENLFKWLDNTISKYHHNICFLILNLKQLIYGIHSNSRLEALIQNTMETARKVRNRTQK